LWHAAIDQDAQRVEAEVVGLELAFGEVPFCEGTNGRPLARGNRLERVAESGAGPKLDFHENEGRALAEDEVDLAVSRAVVALNEDEAAVPEILEREVFAPTPGGAFLQRTTPA
jgi:hypothetical protein